MKQKSIEELKRQMVSTYKKFGNEKALVLKTGAGKKSWTGEELAKEIEEETEFGVNLIDNMIQLAIDLVKRNRN